MEKELLVVLILAVSLALTACGNAEDKAQGKWINQDDGENVTMEIEGDSSVKFKVKVLKDEDGNNWKKID